MVVDDDNSLVFSLLSAAKQDQRGRLGDTDTTLYTGQLEQIARNLIGEHKSDSTKMQVKLVNLLFRSVGGSPSNDLSEVDYVDLNDEEWEEAVTNLVEEMRHTPENAILLCADPEGAVHAVTDESSPSSLGAREYRKIYVEFWLVLGRVALSEGHVVNKKKPSTDMEVSDDDDDEQSPPLRSSTFEVELV